MPRRRWHPAALCVAIALACSGALAALPGFEAVRAGEAGSDTRVLDRHGELLQRLRSNPQRRQGEWVRLEDMSIALRQALLLSEDRRFYEHAGIDWSAAAAAAWGRLWHNRTRGASTITMQLAGLIDDELRLGPGGRSWGQKIGQVLTARELESAWRKDQILEAYLNLVPFRGELVGIDALSRSLFGKAAHGLDNTEAAIAAALVRAPNAAPERVTARACDLLRQMHTAQRLAPPRCEPLGWNMDARLRRRDWTPSDGIAPHAARRALAQASGDRAEFSPAAVHTTLWAPLQRIASDLLNQQLRELHSQRVQDGAIIVLDNASGEVLAWVGSSGSLSEAPEVDAVLAQRQAGSTLKPFLYAQAIAQRRLTAASLIEDAPTHIPTPSGLYIPQNYDRRFHGWVSVRTALASSLNTPAVRTLAMVSPNRFHQQLNRLGLELRETGDYFGLGLALGSPEVSLLRLSNAYRALANQGHFSEVAPLPLAPRRSGATPSPAPPALDPAASFIVGHILSDSNARATTFGTDSILATRFWTAVKTGTSKDMRDNWAVGWSARYTVGVWVGNASGAPMGQVSGSTGAAPIWAGVMQWLHTQAPRHPASGAPVPPPGLMAQAVAFEPRLEAPRQEWFIAGTQQALMRLNDSASPTTARVRDPLAPARILSPTSGTIVALDPDIPPRNQRLTLNSDAPGLRWRIDQRTVARGEKALWSPWPGVHRIELVDARGTVLDAVRIEVRGAGLKADPRGKAKPH
ncbi:penicillin-binding protein 1C [Hydrogenophaga sp. PAMC20947]|uniref:penicillin-binding protein 1C n=1 Tax=Hydrogenophaga sp. PAMC20947 TaxID=2565558 RepID=UPI00109DFFFE|nr:penicillin-binding protein 1C [Hydrogenophaga sp. PAMC20947]QCB48827.1 penicillin-binding protein 1C [Hydrogenophaga sp. PAMC20947]